MKVKPGGAKPGGAKPGGAKPGGAKPGGAADPDSEPISISHVALSLVWTQVLPELFAGGNKEGLARICSRPSYVNAFDLAADHLPGLPTDVTLPWPRPTGQGFWLRYLGRRSLESMPGTIAWSNLVPVRLRLGTMTPGREPSIAILLELYVYPHGLGLVASCRLRDQVPLDDLVGRLAAVRDDESLEMQLDGKLFKGRLAELVEAIIDHVAHVRLHVRATGGGQVDPFSVCTVISATGVEPGIRLSEQSVVHRSLHGLASWSPTWRHDQLGDLKTVAIERASKPPGHVLYTADRGRVTWFPALFGDESRRRHTLSCYHRNLTLLSMTIESLTDMLRVTADDPPRKLIDLSLDQRECLQNAAQALDRLYRGDRTYRSRSAPAQILANGGKAAYDALAPLLNHPPLS